MKISKIISKNNHEYILVKEYKNFIMYEDMITHSKECFNRQELGLVKEQIKAPKLKLNPEKVKIQEVQMNIYGIYDTKNNEQCMRVGTLQEIVKFLNLTAREMSRALRKNNTVRNHYKIYYLFNEEVH